MKISIKLDSMFIGWKYIRSNYDYDEEDDKYFCWEENNFVSLYLHKHFDRLKFSNGAYDGVPYKTFNFGFLTITFGRQGTWVGLP